MKNFFKTLSKFALPALVALATSLVACSGSTEFENAGGTSDEAEGIIAISNKTIAGVSQKGPFVTGSKVTLYGMDKHLNQTDEEFSTTITNNSGKYVIEKVSLKTQYAQIKAEGHYINELKGDTSKQSISLNSLVDLDKHDQVNINVLTHLSFNRIINLVHQGKTITEARRQAEAEVLKAFGMSDEEDSFDQFDILSNNEGDAKLLAISLIMLLANQGEDIDYRLSAFALDFEDDGLLNSTSNRDLIEHVAYEAIFGEYNAVDANLKAMGAGELPEYQQYLNQFAASDSNWTLCSTLNEVQKRNTVNYEYVICRNGKWKCYYGPREVGESPVDTTGQYGTLIDERDGKIYKTLDITMKDGSVVSWMASVMNYEAPKSNYEQIEEDVYGEKTPEYLQQKYANARIYAPHQIVNLPATADKETLEKTFLAEGNIQGICPDGWHIPKKEEWEKLQEAIKGDKQTQRLLTVLGYRETEPQYSKTNNPNDILGYYVSLGGTNFSIEENDEGPLKTRSVVEENMEEVDNLELNNSTYRVTLRCAKN
uniref:Uncharacterized protein n=1 Tax=uncultured bacterium fosmid pJB84D8 TaxID=1478071 RepID=A0A0H3U7Y6_9BACT|nr:hypothetical protein [uncultured bacterium fosmid pJB84D8]